MTGKRCDRGDEFPQWTFSELVADQVGQGEVEALVGGAGPVAHGCGDLGERGASGHPPGGALEETRTFFQHQLDVLAGRDFDAGVVAPGRVRVAPRFDSEVPESFRGDGDLGFVAVRARGDLAERDEGLALAFGSVEDDTCAERLMPFTEHGCAHGKGLADDGFGGADVDDR